MSASLANCLANSAYSTLNPELKSDPKTGSKPCQVRDSRLHHKTRPAEQRNPTPRSRRPQHSSRPTQRHLDGGPNPSRVEPAPGREDHNDPRASSGRGLRASRRRTTPKNEATQRSAPDLDAPDGHTGRGHLVSRCTADTPPATESGGDMSLAFLLGLLTGIPTGIVIYAHIATWILQPRGLELPTPRRALND